MIVVLWKTTQVQGPVDEIVREFTANIANSTMRQLTYDLITIKYVT